MGLTVMGMHPDWPFAILGFKGAGKPRTADPAIREFTGGDDRANPVLMDLP